MEIEDQLDLKADKEMLPMQAGDVERTWADVSNLTRDFGYKSKTCLKEGVGKFIEWYKGYYI
jgi:UDP-glucuronate 4-epimerase